MDCAGGRIPDRPCEPRWNLPPPQPDSKSKLKDHTIKVANISREASGSPAADEPDHDLDDPLKSIRYWGSTVMNLDAQSLVDILAVRWEVEVFFEYEKDLLGSDHYQVMTRQGMLRIWTLTACLQCFLEGLRSQEVDLALTCGDVRHSLQQEHRRNLLKWLKTPFQEGLSMDLICSQLAL